MLIDEHVSIVDDKGCSSEKLQNTTQNQPWAAEKMSYLSSYLNSFIESPSETWTFCCFWIALV